MGRKGGYTLICKCCGKEFNNSNKNKSVCSVECRKNLVKF